MLGIMADKGTALTASSASNVPAGLSPDSCRNRSPNNLLSLEHNCMRLAADPHQERGFLHWVLCFVPAEHRRRSNCGCDGTIGISSRFLTLTLPDELHASCTKVCGHFHLHVSSVELTSKPFSANNFPVFFSANDTFFKRLLTTRARFNVPMPEQ